MKKKITSLGEQNPIGLGFKYRKFKAIYIIRYNTMT
jgi:hypothetical protein